MSDVEEMDYRSQIAIRNRLRIAESRERKLTMAVFGLMAYSAVGNAFTAIASIGVSPLDVGLGLVLAALYSLGVYRAWLKDDIRWWPVAVPAGISVTLLLLAWTVGVFKPIPLLLNAALLVLVPIRKRAAAAVAAVPNNSFKPNPLRGSA